MRCLVILSGTLAVLIACAPTSRGGDQKQQEATVNSNREKDAIAVVKRYIDTEKGWRREVYRLEIGRREGNTLTVSVIHKDDETTPIPGGGRSFAVYVDLDRLQVVKELRFQ